MTANNIANMAMLCGLDIVALTDHNSLKNCPAYFDACAKIGVVPVAGAELCTREEVHVLCLFPSLDAGMAFDKYLEELTPYFVNNPDIYGRQLIVDRNDRVIGEEQKLLVAACDIGIDELPALIRQYGGIAIPSHIDRPSNSLLSNLGFIPPEYEFTCYELKHSAELPRLKKANPALAGAKIIYNSDAHTLEDIAGERRCITVDDKSVAGLLDALRKPD